MILIIIVMKLFFFYFVISDQINYYVSNVQRLKLEQQKRILAINIIQKKTHKLAIIL